MSKTNLETIKIHTLAGVHGGKQRRGVRQAPSQANAERLPDGSWDWSKISAGSW